MIEFKFKSYICATGIGCGFRKILEYTLNIRKGTSMESPVQNQGYYQYIEDALGQGVKITVKEATFLGTCNNVKYNKPKWLIL